MDQNKVQPTAPPPNAPPPSYGTASGSTAPPPAAYSYNAPPPGQPAPPGQQPPVYGHGAPAGQPVAPVQQPPAYGYGGAQQYNAQYGRSAGAVGVSVTPAVTTVHVTSGVNAWSTRPQLAFCSTCNAQVQTTVSYKVGTFTWMVMGILLVAGLWLGCCLIPLCLDGCKDAEHSCSRCRNVLGVKTRM